MILRYKDFLNENLEMDEVLDLYNYFIRILKIHENHFYNDIKISSNDSFKKDINSVFHKMMTGKEVITEDLYNIIHEYESKLYNDDKITPSENNFGCSMWDVCEVILEDPDTLNINRYIQDFSEEDIYVENSLNWLSEDVDNTISNDKYSELIDDIKSKIESTIENSGGEFSTFVDSYNQNPDDYKIEGLINDSDIYEFYLKHRNDIDEVLNDINFFDEVPTENNAFGLYEYIIKGTERAVQELVKNIQ